MLSDSEPAAGTTLGGRICFNRIVRKSLFSVLLSVYLKRTKICLECFSWYSFSLSSWNC